MEIMTAAREPRSKTVPAYALAISLAALAIPVCIAFWFPDWVNNGVGMLIWLTAIIPPFLLSYYRGARGVAVALAGGMAVITATQVSVAFFEIAEPNWTLLMIVLGVYLAVSLGIAFLSEMLLRERGRAEGLALVDSLTGLPSRRHLEIMLTSEFAAAERGGRLSVVMFDLDHFKFVNDKHGHRAGDRALRAFADILAANTRLENLSCRFGGDEFVTVLRGTTREEANLFTSRVLDQMRECPLPWGHQTVSAGVAEHETGMGSFEMLLGAADLALYRAKEAGRDCIGNIPEAGERTPGAPQDGVLPDGASRPAGSASSPAQTLRVWIVGDDAHMRGNLKGMLARINCELWDSGQPFEVVSRFTGLPQAERPDVIITDVIMPEMSGIRMIDAIAKIDRNIRVIYMSGFVQSPISWGGTPGAVAAFLEKPVMMEPLFAALRQVSERDDLVADAVVPLAAEPPSAVR
jgi:diguanylate cyclase (GGDEF)-like protein